MSLTAVIVVLVTDESRDEALQLMQEKVSSIPSKGPDRQKFERLVMMLGALEQNGPRKSMRTNSGNGGGSITEKAQQKRAASLTPRARQLLGAWESREGLLSKRGERMKSWKTRLFMLKGPLLTYHKPLKIAGALSKELGTIDLSVESTIARLAVKSNVQKLKLRTPCFCLCTPFRIYYMQANTEQDREAWMNAINLNISMTRASYQ